jgi:hypothetical protein
MQAGRDVTLNLQNVGLERLSVNATRDLALLAPGATQTYNANAGLALQAGGNLRSNSTFETTLTTTGNLSLSGTNVTMAGRNLSLNSSGNTSLRANQELNLANVTSFGLSAPGAIVEGDLSSNNALFDTGGEGLILSSNGNLDATQTHLRSTGRISANATNNLVVNRVTSPAEVQLSGGNISLASVGNLSGGNYTLNTPGNLTERVPVTNATSPTLGSLNISAGRLFGSGTNTSFSVPNTTSGLAQVAVTAGNDTALNASASMFQYGGVNISLQTTPQTGDIYVDGVLLFQGSPPPPPPDPPAPPPSPVEEPPVPPVNQTLTPDQRAELLAQSNLALGNLGSNSRVLEPEEQERVTVRHDGLRQTFPSNPISPTLELVLPAYTPVVGPGEWQELLSLYSIVSDEMREKDRAAFNAMVDQEVREIWEIRYWRHLLEGLVLWGEVP